LREKAFECRIRVLSPLFTNIFLLFRPFGTEKSIIHATFIVIFIIVHPTVFSLPNISTHPGSKRFQPLRNYLTIRLSSPNNCRLITIPVFFTSKTLHFKIQFGFIPISSPPPIQQHPRGLTITFPPLSPCFSVFLTYIPYFWYI